MIENWEFECSLTEFETCSHWRSLSTTAPLFKNDTLFFAISPIGLGVPLKCPAPTWHFNRCCSTDWLLFCVFFQISAISCWDAFKSFISIHITRNLSLLSNNVTFGPDWRTTLMVALLPGKSIPVLGRTRNFSGDVVFICAENEPEKLTQNGN